MAHANTETEIAIDIPSKQTPLDLEKAESGKTLPFAFNGSGNEYFKIWIVNILLTIITLGIYSAWAKVRNRQYFYGNTQLDGSSFAYLAKPLTILKGRLIAFVLFAIFVAVQNLMPLVSVGLTLLLMVAFPWLVVRSLAFNANNSAYRNVRFGFDGKYGEAFMAILVWPLLGTLTFGLLMPTAFQRQQKFFTENSRYGSSKFSFKATGRDYFNAFIKLIGIVIVGVILVVAVSVMAPEIAPILTPIVMVPLYLYAILYLNITLMNMAYNNSLLAEHGFKCSYEWKSYALLLITNSLFTALTLGIYIPWAKVRSAQYLADHLEFIAEDDLSGFAAAEQEKVSALGQEIGDVFDMEFGM
ncbi:YjgN family protein [Pseudomonadota bacterium]